MAWVLVAGVQHLQLWTDSTPLPVQSVAAEEFSRDQKRRREELESVDLSQYQVVGEEEDWEVAVGAAQPGIVSVAR